MYDPNRAPTTKFASLGKFFLGFPNLSGIVGTNCKKNNKQIHENIIVHIPSCHH